LMSCSVPFFRADPSDRMNSSAVDPVPSPMTVPDLTYVNAASAACCLAFIAGTIQWTVDSG